MGIKLNDENFVFISLGKAKEFSRSIARRGDLVFTCWGSINQIGLIHEKSKYSEYVVSNKQMKLTVDPKRVDPKYLYYVFSSPEKQQEILANGIGAAVPGFNLGQLKRHVFRLPPLDVQQGIVRTVDALDIKIDLSRRINQTLEAMAQAIFKSWFVDFDPVKAKIVALAEGRDPLRAAMSAISGKPDAELEALPPEQYEQLAATAALFPEEMETSELGEIPRRWSASKVETLLSRLSAKTRYTREQVSEYGQIPVFEQGASILLGFHNGAASYPASSENPMFIFGDHTCVTRLSFQSFDISQNVIPLQGQGRATAWVYYAVKEKQKFQEYRRHWMELISKDVVVATPDICLEFSKKISNLHLQMEANERQTQSLRELRDTLLPKLLSGELSVEALAEQAGIA
ncbi:restriction endonuclease subunit S [Pseudomonas sp. E141]